MAEEIHYDDDLFFIITRIQLLKNGLLLNLDNYFKEYYLNDLILIDKSLVLFQEKLTNSQQLVKLADYTQTLGRAETMLVDLLTSLKKGDLPLAKTFAEQEVMLDTLITRHSNNALALIERLKTGVTNYKDADTISEEELSILLTLN